MIKVGKFEKVSYNQFAKDMRKCFGDYDETLLLSMYNDIRLPTRSTSGSAGYDFKANFNMSIYPGEEVLVPTGIRVAIEDGWWLGCLPRSGLGFKYRMGLANTCGVIDSDYYFSDNEGHIMAKLVNNGDEHIEIWIGEGFMQGIFIPYGITYDDHATAVRNGGFGSTDEQNKGE